MTRILAFRMLTHDVSATVCRHDQDDQAERRYSFQIWRHDSFVGMWPSESGECIYYYPTGDGPEAHRMALDAFERCRDWPMARDWIAGESEEWSQRRLGGRAGE